jgi:dethiobiotin synthetase
MKKGIFILGTDTDVGKTFVSAIILNLLKQNGCKPCYYKPIASGTDFVDGKEIAMDVNYIKKMCDFDESLNLVTPFVYKTEVSPHLASKLENKKIDINVVFENYKKIKGKYDYVIVEGCGGFVVPLIDNDYFVYDLIKDLKLECFLVTRAGVGTINHTAMTVEYAKKLGIKINGIIINFYNNKFYENDNIEMIEKITEIPVMGKISTLENDKKQNKDNNSINFNTIVDKMCKI